MMVLALIFMRGIASRNRVVSIVVNKNPLPSMFLDKGLTQLVTTVVSGARENFLVGTREERKVFLPADKNDRRDKKLPQLDRV